MKRAFGIVIVASVLAGGVLAVCLVSRGPGGRPGTQGHLVATSGAAPAAAGPVVCANASVLNGPSTAPAGAVTIAAGTNQAQATGQSNTTYWLAPGTHTLGTGQYNQFQPASGDVYEGAPGAVINGQNANDYAFVSTATNVTVEYLTIENFVAPQSEGVVNQNSAANWTIQDDTIENNPNGAGAMLGTNDVLTHNCLTKNGQYGFQSYSAAGQHTVTVTDNEISYNDTKNYTTSTPGCGCTGGAKFWATTRATITGTTSRNEWSASEKIKSGSDYRSIPASRGGESKSTVQRPPGRKLTMTTTIGPRALPRRDSVAQVRRALVGMLRLSGGRYDWPRWSYLPPPTSVGQWSTARLTAGRRLAPCYVRSNANPRS